jgi:hypothetical protein
MIANKLSSTLIVAFCLVACENLDKKAGKPLPFDPELLHEATLALENVLVNDIFTPPVASRIYAYSSIASFEVVINEDTTLQTLAGRITDFSQPPSPKEDNIDFGVAAAIAYLHTAKAFIYSEPLIQNFSATLLDELKLEGMDEERLSASVKYGEMVAEHVIRYSKADNYALVKAMPRYTVKKQVGKWSPTPPDYMDAVEPNWRKMRPFTLDSASQFAPPKAPSFSVDKQSDFYKLAIDVLGISKNLSEEQRAIANFWDCNPFATRHEGHVMVGVKKISPGAHWIGIARTASRTSKATLSKAAEAYALVSIALFDSFISCWDEKYRSELIRPETYINSYIDTKWKPLLSTPPFPEYTSGHSVISASSAQILNHLFGDNFSYIDSVEVDYELPPKSFQSFTQAADEAGISRLYGGIHYRPAIENGKAQGRAVGQWVLQKIKIRK